MCAPLGTLGHQSGDAEYLWYLDVNGDERINVVDGLAFGTRLGARLNPSR